MIDVYVSDLIKHLKGNLIIGDPRLNVKRISINTRNLERGDFFIAIKGKRFDGHDFLAQTLEKGAAGLIVNRLDKKFGNNPLTYRQLPTVIKVDDTLNALHELARMYRQRFVPEVIGITGSNGKTTTKELLASILCQNDQCLSTRGNYNNHIGLPLTILNLVPEQRYLVVEMGASARGDIALLAGIAQPHIGIITNIGPAHLETFGSIDNVFQTKMELLHALPEDGEAIINADDPMLFHVKETLKCRVTTYGVHNPCDVKAQHVVSSPKASFQLAIRDSVYPVTLMHQGLFNVYNALAAAAAAWRLGIAPDAIVSGLESSSVPTMHNEVMSTESENLIINDAYNANPASMRASLTAFIEGYPDRIKVVVLGDMRELGSQSEKEHRSLGEFLAGLSIDVIKLFGTYKQHIAEGAVGAGMDKRKIRSYDNISELIKELAKLPRSSCAVFFKASRDMKFEIIIDELLKKQQRV